MSEISVEQLLEPISAEEPSGPNMEYDAAYMAVERIAQGKPERQMGDQIVAAEDPEWRKLLDGCVELLGKTKDLRLAMYLTISLLKLESLPGLRDGLALMHGLIEHFWDSVHPQLDPDDDDDPTERVNIIDSLSRPPNTDGDPMKFQQRIREVPLCESKQIGRFSYRDIAVATGEIAPVTVAGEEDTIPPDTAVIEAAFMDSDLDELTAKAEAINESIEHTKAIEQKLNELIGVGNAPDLSSFVSALTEVQKALSEYLTKRGVGTPGLEDEEAGGDGEGGEGGGGPALSGEVRSRQDVLTALEKISRYYDLHEPASPVPLILRRAHRLATMNFIEIIKDLSPDAISQIEVISGVDSESEGS